MKDKINDVIKYILREYPGTSELSASRLTKMLYLIDWKSVLLKDRQVTQAKWLSNNFGPYVEDFIEIAAQDSDIEVKPDATALGAKKKLVQLKHGVNPKIQLDIDDEKVIRFVIDATKSKNYEDVMKLVYSTYPVITGGGYSELDLVSAAREYKELVARKKPAAQKTQPV